MLSSDAGGSVMGFAANYVRNLAAVVAGRQPTRPLLISYYVTHRCALDCVYCSDGQGRPFKQDQVKELNTRQACDLLSLLRISADTLDITGGEPLLRDDLETILEHAHAIGFRTVLNTKGIGLRDRPRILELVDVLVLSIDSLQARKLGELLGESETRAGEVLDVLRYLFDVAPELRSRIVLASVATPGNLPDVLDVLRLAEKERCGFQISPQIVGTIIHPHLRNNPDFMALIDEVIAAKRRGVGVMGIPEYLRGIRDVTPFVCHPMLMPTIRPDGTLYYPCLEKGDTTVNILHAKGYEQALAIAQAQRPSAISCEDECHLFCHMALSLLQRHPLSALAELRSWGGLKC